MHAFVGESFALFDVGVADLAAVCLLVGCVHAATSPGKLRDLHNVATGVAVTALMPFVGAAAVVGYYVAAELTRHRWAFKVFDAQLVRNVVCCLIILALGAISAASPQVGSHYANYTLARLWTTPDFEASLPEMLFANVIMLALPAAAIAAVVVPLRAATRTTHLRRPPAPWVADPVRFAGCSTSPPPSNPPIDLHT